MFSPASARAASSYRQTNVDGASPHQLINLLFERTLQAVRIARNGLRLGDMAQKGEQIGLAVRYIEEGLKLCLNKDLGGELAVNLDNLYDYCVRQLTQGNLHNDESKLAEVQGLVESVAEGWRGIAAEAQTQRSYSVAGA